MTPAPLKLSGRKILVVGLGRSGRAAARLCFDLGARVTVTDRKSEADLGDSAAGLPAGVVREFGGHRAETFRAADLVVLSPGVPDGPEIAAARAGGVPVTGELELASRFVSALVVAITGTNGKSTTTALCGAILRSTGRPTFVGGNLGEPLAEAVATPPAGPGGVCVVECSSFQLETVETFRPRIAVLLNLTADHLDRYPDMAAYAAAKARIFAAQGPADFAVVNVDDPLVVEVAAGLRARRIEISTRRPIGSDGGWGEDGGLGLRLMGGGVERYPFPTAGLLGRHNQENALAALAAARLAGATPTEAVRALHAFRPLAHRMELVAETRGIAYFDDSKGTNVGAVCAAIGDFPRPVVLIAGGRDKGGDYAPLAAALGRVGRGAVLIGEAADRIAAALAPILPVERAPSMRDAVAAATRMARPGDAVVLSPACSSFDMFRDYEHRAQVFRDAVKEVA